MIYLDHAAGTVSYPLDIPTNLYANPSSIHGLGRVVRGELDIARRSIAEDLECESSEIVFTSGATEAVHLAIIGHYLARREQRTVNSGRGVVYSSPLVHSCVWAALNFLETHFQVEIKLLPVDKSGFLDLDQIGEVIFSEADIIVTEFGNSEIGLLQPVTKLGKKLDKWAQAHQNHQKPTYIVDAAAAVVTEKIVLEYQKCDFLTLSGEKFGGLKGSGVLLHRRGVGLNPIIGGSHELGYRGGTENVVGTLAFANALRLHSELRTAIRERLVDLHNLARTYFQKNLPNCKITTPEQDFLPHVFHFIIPNSTAAVFVARADQAGLAISAGSACSSGTTTESKVLKHLGLSEQESNRGVRISFGRTTTQEELEAALDIIKNLLG